KEGTAVRSFFLVCSTSSGTLQVPSREFCPAPPLRRGAPPSFPEGPLMQLSTPPATRVRAAEHPAHAGGPAGAGGPASVTRTRSARGAQGGRRIRPVTERIACWSARHAVIALVGWLLMVGGALLAGHVYGTQSQPQYDPGRSGVAERMLDRLH